MSLDIIAAFLVLAGSLMMLLSIKRYCDLGEMTERLAKEGNPEFLLRFKAHLFLMIFFLLSYLIVFVSF